MCVPCVPFCRYTLYIAQLRMRLSVFVFEFACSIVYLVLCCVFNFVFGFVLCVQFCILLFMQLLGVQLCVFVCAHTCVYSNSMHPLQMGLMGPARLPDLLINTSLPLPDCSSHIFTFFNHKHIPQIRPGKYGRDHPLVNSSLFNFPSFSSPPGSSFISKPTHHQDLF